MKTLQIILCHMRLTTVNLKRLVQRVLKSNAVILIRNVKPNMNLCAFKKVLLGKVCIQL